MRYTTNLNLPLYEENDITSWLTVYNPTMQAIDDAFGSADTDITQAKADITLLQTAVGNINDAIETIQDKMEADEGDIDDLQEAYSGLNTLVGTLNNTVTALAARVNNCENLVGKKYSGIIGVGETTLTLEIPELTFTSMVDIYFGGEPLMRPENVTEDLENHLLRVFVTERLTSIPVIVLIRN